MLFSILSFAVGIIIVQQFSTLLGLEGLAVLGFLAILCVMIRQWQLLLFCLGMLWAIIFSTYYLTDRLDASLEGELIKVEGRVIGLPQYDERSVRFDFNVLKSSEKLPDKVRLSWFFAKQTIKAGQMWQFTVKLKRPHGRFNPHAFDYEKWLFTRNIGATGYIRRKPAPQLLANYSIRVTIDILRQKISDKLTAVLKNSHYIGLIKALTIGDRHEIDYQQWRIFSQTGTIHLLAISGLHIGLVAGMAYFIALRIGIFLTVASPQIGAAVFSLGNALFYSALAGFSMPTQRALLMILLAVVARCWQRNIKILNTLAIAFFTVLIFDPLAVLSAGFWLSFLAVGLIVYSLAGRLRKAHYWVTALRTHWVTAIGLSPLLVFYFQQVSIIAPIANLLVVPIVSLLVVPLCLISVGLLFLLPVFSTQLLSFVESLLDTVLTFLSMLVALPYAFVSTGMIPFYTVPFAIMGVLILFAPKGLSQRWLGMILFLPIVFVHTNKLKQGEILMTVLDVGQGLAVVVETQQHTLVFDTGAKYSSRYNMGDAVILPFLHKKGINNIDTLLISHGDNDHIGGAEFLLDNIAVKTVLTSAPELLKKYSPVVCQAGQSWQWDNVKFEVLSPSSHFQGSENDNSCVLKVRSKQGSILLTGDIEKNAETWLLNNAAQSLASDILLAPHHGSKTSSSAVFVKHVNPKLTIVSSGYRNRFSFPHKQVTERYDRHKIPWLNTADKGAVIVTIKNHALFIDSAREQQGRYWN